MQSTVSECTIEEFRDAAASAQPAPAAVALAAVSASLAFGLLAKVLHISGKRKDFAGNALQLTARRDTAGKESKRMLELADEDISAFNAYMTSVKQPRGNDREQQERDRAMNSAVAKVIEAPLEAACAAASGIELGSNALASVPVSVIADLGSVVLLLAVAVRVFLLCADSNLRQLVPNDPSYRDVFSAARERQAKALRIAESVHTRVTEMLKEAGINQRRNS